MATVNRTLPYYIRQSNLQYKLSHSVCSFVCLSTSSPFELELCNFER